MALITTPQNPEYDRGFESTFGRKCFYCKKALDETVESEWKAQAHASCESAANAFADDATAGAVAPAAVPAVSSTVAGVTLAPVNDAVVHESE